ncbi:MAG: hypothetical protein HC897_00890 [Thermoanaerobaculia bacterium]|nr:hypothetical protein [Thermoanaerobaculia bacterium]
MIPDPIAQEVRAAREAHAARFSFDWAATFIDLKRSEQQRARKTSQLLSPPDLPAPRPEPPVRGVRFSQR